MELLLQLAGHLQGRVFWECNLIGDSDHQDYSQAVKALKGRLDPSLRTLEAQDFRHTRQREAETVTDLSVAWSGLSSLPMRETLCPRRQERCSMDSCRRAYRTSGLEVQLCQVQCHILSYAWLARVKNNARLS